MMTSLFMLLVAAIQAGGVVERSLAVVAIAVLAAAVIIYAVIRWALGKISELSETSIRREGAAQRQEESITRLTKTVEGISEKLDGFMEAGAESREKVTDTLRLADHRLEAVERAAEYIARLRPLKHGLPNWADAVQTRIDCLEQESQSPFRGHKWPKLESDP